MTESSPGKRSFDKLEKENEEPGSTNNNDNTPPHKKLRTSETGQSDSKQSKEEAKAERQRQKEEKRKAKEEEKRKREEEKEQQRKLKEEERKRKEQEKKKREEEKERERKRKEEEKENEKKRKEEEKEKERQRKEEEKRKKEEEKRKKEEAELAKQPKIASFFSFKSKKTNNEGEQEKHQKKQQHQLEKDTNSGDMISATTVSDFDSTFLPFHIKPNCIVYNTLSNTQKTDSEEVMKNWLVSQRRSDNRGYSIRKTVPEIVDMMTLGQATEEEIVSALDSLPRKHLQFLEDVRPPYTGTFSKPKCWFASDPFSRAVEALNYDYDSEAEWVQDDGEGEGGEDLGEEIEDESEDALDEEDEDMDEFVAADDERATRRSIIGPLVPVIKWNNGGNIPEDSLFESLQVEYLCDIDGPIDPFKDYWSAQKASNTMNTSPSGAKKRKMIPEESMKEFLSKIQGQEMNQILLVEILKKDFPKFSKEMIRSTLKECARRVGEKEPEKRWEIVSDFAKQYELE